MARSAQKRRVAPTAAQAGPVWPADRVERRPVASLVPYARNARTHSEAQVAQLAASVTEWGWTTPVLVDEAGQIIAGHGRVLAAQRLGLAEVPVMVAAGWSETQKRAYVIADNKLAENAGWDENLLRLELGELQGLGFDPATIGFDADALKALFAGQGTQGNTDPDAVPEPPAEQVTQAGDVWLLGQHRLACGDSTDAATVARVMDGEQASLLLTSPPYAQQRDYKSGGIADWDALMQGVFAVAPVDSAGQILVNLGLVHRDGEWLPYWQGWIDWMREQGWRRFGWYVWDQGPGLPGDWNGRLAPSHEFVFHFNREAERARKTQRCKMAGAVSNGGLRNTDGSIEGRTKGPSAIQQFKIPDSVIRVTRHKGGLGNAGSHPAPFPVALPRELIEAFSDVGDIVFEPFSGSGTTIIAAEMTGRHCRAIEMSPEYCDVAVRRWEEFTGRKAERQASA